MSVSKGKSKKQNKDDKIDIYNTNFLSLINEDTNSFKAEQTEIDNYKKKLSNIKNKLEDLEKTNVFTPEIINRKSLYKQQIEDLTDKISQLENNTNEMNYIMDVGNLIEEYSTNQDNSEKSMMMKIINNDVSDKDETHKIMKQYMTVVKSISLDKHTSRDRLKLCNKCNVEKILYTSNGLYTCPSCGDAEYVIIDEDNQIKDFSAYKKINHFKTWLNKIQAKEPIEIPDNYLDQIRESLADKGYTDNTKISVSILKDVLKKLKMNKYYNNVVYIHNKITGIPPPRFTKRENDLLIAMFFETQKPLEEIKKKYGRLNNISYPFLIHKFLKLLDINRYSSYFVDMKTQKKRRKQDDLWHNLCEMLNWPIV